MGSGFKDWSPGDVLTAADVDGYLMRQTVMTFADASARDTALSGVLDEGMVAYLEDTNVTTYYDGSSWEDIRGLGGGSATSPGGFSSGDVIDAADMNGLPAGLLDSDQPVANVAISSTPATVGSLSFTLSASRTVMVGFSVPIVRNWSSVSFVDFVLKDGATSLLVSRIGVNNQGCSVQRLLTLSAASYSYDLEVSSDAGTAQIFGGASHLAPLIYALDVGP